jgi:hypothetical protein
MVMLGFAGAFRKSEVVALDVEDLEFCDEGVRVIIRRSRTDQEAKGQTIAVLRGAGPFCPVRLSREWLDAAGIIEGALFRQVPKGGKVSRRSCTQQANAGRSGSFQVEAGSAGKAPALWVLRANGPGPREGPGRQPHAAKPCQRSRGVPGRKGAHQHRDTAISSITLGVSAGRPQ